MTQRTHRALSEVAAAIEKVRSSGFRKGKITVYIEEGEPTGIDVDAGSFAKITEQSQPIGGIINSFEMTDAKGRKTVITG